MAVIISECSKMKTYHRSGCLYEMRMKTRNRYSVSEEQARDLGYRPCKCCWTLKGALRALHMTLPGLGHQKNMELTYRDSTDTLFMRTASGRPTGKRTQVSSCITSTTSTRSCPPSR